MIDSVTTIEDIEQEDIETLRCLTSVCQTNVREFRREVGLQTYPFKTVLTIVDRIPNDFDSDYYICPMAFNGCEGAKAPGFYGRCAGDNYPFMNCDLWDTDLSSQRYINHHKNKPRTKSHLEDESIHDAVAEGIDLSRLSGFSAILHRKNFGRVSEYNL